jgi:hypothetical protein
LAANACYAGYVPIVISLWRKLQLCRFKALASDEPLGLKAKNGFLPGCKLPCRQLLPLTLNNCGKNRNHLANICSWLD